MGNPFYGTVILDDKKVEKALKTSEGIKRVASLVQSMKKLGLLAYIDKYSKIYNVPREYVFGIILDEQFRSHDAYEINSGDLGDYILSFIDVAGTSTGLGQTEPALVAKCFLNYGYQPVSGGGIDVFEKLKNEALELYYVEYDDTGMRDTGMSDDEWADEDWDDFDEDELADMLQKMNPQDLSKEFYNYVNSKLTKDNEFVVELISFLLDYYRKEWRSIEGIRNLENWNDSIDEWDVIAYTYSTGLEALKTKGSFAEPDDRVKQGLPYRPSGSSRGRGIGQMGRAAVKTLTDIDETIRLSESDIRRLIKELLHTKLI